MSDQGLEAFLRITQDDDWEVLDERDVYREEYLDMARAALAALYGED